MPASLTVSQRVRVTLWFQASWWVPVSSSRPISGAPQKMPIRAGRGEYEELGEVERGLVVVLEVVEHKPAVALRGAGGQVDGVGVVHAQTR